MTQISRMAGSI